MTTRSLFATLAATATAVVLGAGAGPAFAETHEVLMLNADPDNPRERMVYEPAVLKIEPGDTVRFVSEDPAHNAVSEVVPEGGKEWKSPINKDYEVTLETEGTYFYYCQPHYALGMVGLILVGDHTGNLDAVKEVNVRGRKAEERLQEYVAQAEEMSTASAE